MQFLDTIISAITTPIRILYYWGSQCVPGVKALGRLSLPMKWALVALLFCLINLIAAVLTDSSWNTTNSIRWIVFLVGSIVIPFLVFFFVKFLLMEEQSRFPELDRVWFDGLRESESKGIDLATTPIFLILGAKSRSEAKTMMELTDLDLPVSVPASGESLISFHAGSRGIFLFLNGCSCVSRMSFATGVSSVNKDLTRTNPLPHQQKRETLLADDASSFGMERSMSMHAEAPAMLSAEPRPVAAGSTMQLDDIQDVNEILMQPTGGRSLSSQDALECTDRLRHMCKLIKKSRGPVCPINGIVVAIPMDLVENSCGGLQVAIQKDLELLRSELKVRCSITSVITGMEQDEGFIEFTKRLPAQQITENRMGKGCQIWASPEMSRLDAISVHATGAFEDWIYTLFQKDDALKKSRNSKLFQLLVRVRGTFATNLRVVLSQGFGFDPTSQPWMAKEQFLFSGCYFVAAGTGPSQQAFVKSVFAKVLDQEGDLEWSPAAKRADRYYMFLANIAALVGMLALLTTIGVLIYYFNRTPVEP